MTTMMRLSLSLFLLVVFTNEASGQEICYACKGPEFMMTTPDVTFDAGLETLSCNDLNEIAAQRPGFSDVCFITQGYAEQFCNCQDANGNPPPDLPFNDDAPPCNICGGPNGSDFWTIDPALEEEPVFTTVGIQAKCGFLFSTALEGAFTAGQCPRVQEATREACGCAARDVDGNPVNPTAAPPPTPAAATPPPSPAPIPATPQPTPPPTPPPTPAPIPATPQPVTPTPPPSPAPIPATPQPVTPTPPPTPSPIPATPQPVTPTPPPTPIPATPPPVTPPTPPPTTQPPVATPTDPPVDTPTVPPPTTTPPPTPAPVTTPTTPPPVASPAPTSAVTPPPTPGSATPPPTSTTTPPVGATCVALDGSCSLFTGPACCSGLSCNQIGTGITRSCQQSLDDGRPDP